jgi:hypothetical protein
MATRGRKYKVGGTIYAGTLAEAEKKQLDEKRPKARHVRGNCPECGAVLLSNLYYIEGKGYLLIWECEAGLMEEPTCTYRRVI